MRFSKSERILPQYEGPVSTAKKQKKEERHKQLKEKQLHGKFRRETEEVRSEETCKWIRKGYLKKETKGLDICSIRTNPKNELDKKLMAKRYQKNVECVGKEMSQSLTSLQSVKRYPRKSKAKT